MKWMICSQKPSAITNIHLVGSNRQFLSSNDSDKESSVDRKNCNKEFPENETNEAFQLTPPSLFNLVFKLQNIVLKLSQQRVKV